MNDTNQLLSDFSTLGDLPYAIALKNVQEGVSGQVGGLLEGKTEEEMKDLILRYIREHGITCSLTDSSTELTNYIYHDMSGLSFISREGLYETAKHSMGCTEGSGAVRMEIRLLLEDYHAKKAQYDSVMTVVDELCMQIPAVQKLLAIKGIGILTVAGFFAEVGDLGRFQSPKQIQKLAGLAIRENSSGKHKGQSGISKRGRRRLRALLFRAILPLVATNKEFADIHNYYTSRKDNPLKKKQSLIALCCKLIRVFFALATKNEDYDPIRLLGDIRHPVAVAA